MKESHLTIRIDPELKEKLKAVCKKNYSSATAEITRFIVNFVKDNKDKHAKGDTYGV